MKQSRCTVLGVVALVAVIGIVKGETAALAQKIPALEARVVATNIPGASALSPVGTFLNSQAACARPMPTLFHRISYQGRCSIRTEILVGSRSNFGAPLAEGGVKRGRSYPLTRAARPSWIYRKTSQALATRRQLSAGLYKLFSANSPFWLNSVNNPDANSGPYAGVSNPLGLSNNNAFGRIWPANSPLGERGMGSSSILDPTGLPLKGAPNSLIGGVYVGSLTNRDAVAMPTQPQVIRGALKRGAVGTALLGPSPDGTCKAVFAVVTADGAIVQEDTLKGLDGLAPAGTIKPLLGQSWDSS